ncbi:predicted protein [Histoplasma capsulatum var. duboisii H88]|uniref:Predicted protein n=1 Tax=Ajellomyces capsulatus (strain H88) TaxID=544711 RepID=F0UBP8_AJEC8|nr:predicted protein [Histoplasma capsulatum var. duboisii H88]
MAVHETRSVHRLNRATACEVVPMDPSMDPPWLSSNCVLLPRTWALCLESVLIIFQIPVYAAAYFHVWHPDCPIYAIIGSLGHFSRNLTVHGRFFGCGVRLSALLSRLNLDRLPTKALNSSTPSVEFVPISFYSCLDSPLEQTKLQWLTMASIRSTLQVPVPWKGELKYRAVPIPLK